MATSKPDPDPQRERRLLETALDLPPDARAAFLDRECANNVALRRELERLLVLADDDSLSPPNDVGGARELRRLALGSASSGSIDLTDPGSHSAWDAFLGQLRSRGPVHERYEVDGEIGRGGMGVVYRAFDRDVRRPLALKTLRRPAIGGTDASLVGRFVEEAQVTGQLQHPGIVPVHDVGIDADGQLYFTMKLVDGEDLRAVFDRVHDEDDTDWTATRAVDVLLRVCEAMAFAHDKGVIHRDLKPANVMVGCFGEVHVMDWGLAKVLGRDDHLASGSPSTPLQSARQDLGLETPGSPLLTQPGSLMGTPAYMPPEQARGDVLALAARGESAFEPTRSHRGRDQGARPQSYGPYSEDLATQRSATRDRVGGNDFCHGLLGRTADVYAIGAMLYHLLAGHSPYAYPGATPDDVRKRVVNGPPAPLTSVSPRAPAELVAIAGKAMARDPDRRYPDVSALARDLRAYMDNRVVSAHKTGVLVEMRKWIDRNRALATAAGAAVLLAVALSWIASRLLAEQRRRAAEVEAQLAAEAAERAERDIAQALASMIPAEPDPDFVDKARTVRAGVQPDFAAAARLLDSALEVLPGHPVATAARQFALDRLSQLSPSPATDAGASTVDDRDHELIATITLDDDAESLLLKAIRLAQRWPWMRKKAIPLVREATLRHTGDPRGPLIFLALLGPDQSAEQAAHSADRLLRRWPDDPDIAFYAGRAVQTHDPARAEALFRIARTSENLDIRDGALFQLAQVVTQLGRRDDGRAIAEEAIPLVPPARQGALRHLQAMIEAPLSDERAQRLRQASDLGDPWATVNLAIEHLHKATAQGKTEMTAEERELLQRALVLDPDNYVALVNLSVHEEDIGRRYDMVERARHPWGWSLLGYHWHRNKDLDRARECLDRALALDPDCIHAHINYAQIGKDTVDVPLLRTHAQAILRVDPDNPAALQHLAIAEFLESLLGQPLSGPGILHQERATEWIIRALEQASRQSIQEVPFPLRQDTISLLLNSARNWRKGNEEGGVRSYRLQAAQDLLQALSAEFPNHVAVPHLLTWRRAEAAQNLDELDRALRDWRQLLEDHQAGAFPGGTEKDQQVIAIDIQVESANYAAERLDRFPTSPDGTSNR